MTGTRALQKSRDPLHFSQLLQASYHADVEKEIDASLFSRNNETTPPCWKCVRFLPGSSNDFVVVGHDFPEVGIAGCLAERRQQIISCALGVAPVVFYIDCPLACHYLKGLKFVIAELLHNCLLHGGCSVINISWPGHDAFHFYFYNLGPLWQNRQSTSTGHRERPCLGGFAQKRCRFRSGDSCLVKFAPRASKVGCSPDGGAWLTTRKVHLCGEKVGLPRISH